MAKRVTPQQRKGEPPVQIVRDGHVLRFRETTFLPKTWNPETRTIDVVVVSFEGAAGERSDWWTGERWIEELSLDPAHIRLGRANRGGMPYLANHSQDIRDQLGSSVENSARVVDGVGLVCTMRLAERAEVQGLITDIVSGVIRNGSAGYATHHETKSKDPGGLDRRLADDWELHEFSAVAVGFDAGSQTRSSQQEPIMKLSAEARAAFRHYGAKVRASEEQMAAIEEAHATVMDACTALDEAIAAAKTEDPAEDPAAEPLAEPARTEEDGTARSLGILAAARALGVPQTRAETLIADKSKTLEETRAMLINERARATPAVQGASSVQFGADHSEQVREGRINALLHRAAPQKHKLTDAGRAQMSDDNGNRMTMLSLARATLRDQGIDTRGWPDSRVARHALSVRTQTMSDFTSVLQDAIGVSLLPQGPEWAPDYERFCAVGQFKNLQDRHPTRLSGVAVLPTVAEAQDYPLMSMVDTGESYGYAKLGGIVPITVEAIMRDQLGAFDRIPTALQLAAIRAKAQIVYGLLTANAAMSDSVALFHATHANLISASAGVPTATRIDAMELLLAAQTDEKGALLDLKGKILVAPRGLKLTTEQLYSARYVPTASTGVMIEDQFGLERLYTAFLTGTAYYLFADPAVSPVLEYAYPEGEEGAQVSQEGGFDNDTQKFKITEFFGAGVVDYRGAVKTPGA